MGRSLLEQFFSGSGMGINPLAEGVNMMPNIGDTVSINDIVNSRTGTGPKAKMIGTVTGVTDPPSFRRMGGKVVQVHIDTINNKPASEFIQNDKIFSSYPLEKQAQLTNYEIHSSRFENGGTAKVIQRVESSPILEDGGTKLKVLVACEESQAVTKAFREFGHEAFSNDLKSCTGGHPEWHLQGDALKIINDRDWDLLIAHPPCTYVAGSSVQWLSHPEDRDLPFADRRPHPKYPNRRKDMQESIEFAIALHDCKIPKVCIENPIGLLSSAWRKPDQIIQPYMFGDEATKSTCLWLKNLPKLVPTKMVGKGERTTYKSGKSMPKWYADALSAKSPEERRTLRSKTFLGIANAMAMQWGQ